MTSSGTRKKPLIYRITNSVDGKFYIGVTAGGLMKRRREHLFAARHETDGGRSRLYNAIRKYGPHNFTFEVLSEHEDYPEALAAEISAIKLLSPPYNITAGGQGCPGFKMPRDIVERLAAQRRGSTGHWLGKKRPDIAVTSRLRMLTNPLRFWKGKKRSPQTIAKIVAAKTGMKRGKINELQREVFAENMRRAARARRKPVMCTNDGMRFASATEADKHYGLTPLSTSAVANGRRNSVYGLKFIYVEEPDAGAERNI